MRLFSTLAIFTCASLFGSGEIDRYLDLYRSCPKAFGTKGDWTQGESETITDYDQICAVQTQAYHRFLARGYSAAEAEERSRLGILTGDGFWIWVREALKFPSGETDVYNRFIHRSTVLAPPGKLPTSVSVLVEMPDGKLLTNLIFRNGTRSWEIELPRGGIERGESSEDAAKREAKEETGYSIEDVRELGAIPLDSHISPFLFKVFYAKASELGDTERDGER